MSYMQLRMIQWCGFVTSLLVLIKQVRHMTSRSHRQAPGDPFHRNRRFGAQPHRQADFEGMPFAPPDQLLLADALVSKNLRDRSEERRVGKECREWWSA